MSILNEMDEQLRQWWIDAPDSAPPLIGAEQYINPRLEATGLLAYVSLATGFQRLAEAKGQGHSPGPDLTDHLLDAIGNALCWMGASGLPSRHPDLAEMPTTVDPCDFQGGAAGVDRWVMDELKELAQTERGKLYAMFN